jgi:hypothetical protein
MPARANLLAGLLPMALWAATCVLAHHLIGGPPAPQASAQQRMREGEVVEFVGTLELSGDRAVFHPQEGGEPLRLLENLALERVTRVLSESHGEHQWQVRGELTEYRGANYLLLLKAVQRGVLPAAGKP